MKMAPKSPKIFIIFSYTVGRLLFEGYKFHGFDFRRSNFREFFKNREIREIYSPGKKWRPTVYIDVNILCSKFELIPTSIFLSYSHFKKVAKI